MTKYTGRQKCILVCLYISNCSSFMCISLLPPFFPKESDLRGISSSIYGWIFGIFALVQFLSSPVFGKTVSCIGARPQFLSGVILTGACTILFGFLDAVPYKDDDGRCFVILAFIIYISLALGVSACTTANFVISTQIFREDATTVLGLLESASGTGLMVGPALGGFIYEPLGFEGPFIVIGIFIFLSVPVYWAVIEAPSGTNSPDAVEEQKSVFSKLMSNPQVIVICIVIFMSSTSWIVIEPTLEPHLRQYDLRASYLGLIFLLTAGTYAILSPLVGRLSDRMVNSTPLLPLGYIFSVIGLLLLGPSPLTGLENYDHLWLNLVSLFLVGVGCAFSIIPTFDKLLSACEKANMEETLALYGAIAGLWNCVFSLGEFVGPVLAGWLFEEIGFAWCMTVIAALDVLMVIVTVTMWCLEESSSGKQETTPLLQSY